MGRNLAPWWTMIHYQGLDKLDELSSRRTMLLELLASNSSEWSPKTSSHHLPKPISREALPQKQLPMLRKTRWASIQTLCSSEAWWGGNQFDPGPGLTTKTLSTSFVSGSFLQDDVSKDWSWWKSKDPFRSIISMTSSICERCWKHDICYRIPKCWPWEDACAASCRSMGECPRCKSWLFPSERSKIETVRDMDNIYIYNMIYKEVLIQLVSMRFSLYCKKSLEKLNFTWEPPSRPRCRTWRFQGVQKKKPGPSGAGQWLGLPQTGPWLFPTKNVIFHSKGVKWRHPPFKRKRLFFFTPLEKNIPKGC